MSATLKMLKRYSYDFRNKKDFIDLIQNMPLGFHKEVLALKGYSLKNKGISDEKLPKAWGNAIRNMMSNIDSESSSVSEIQGMTESGSLLSSMRGDYNIILAKHRKQMKRLREIISLAVKYQELVS